MREMTLELPELKPQATTSVALHMLPFHDVATSKKPVTTIDGYLVGGPDRRGANAISPAKLWSMWQRDVLARLDSVPDQVQDYFVRTKHLTSPPKTGDSIESPGTTHTIKLEDSLIDLEMEAGKDFQVVIDDVRVQPVVKKKLANPPRFATSYTGMNEFLQCPRKWSASKFYKTVPYEEGLEAAWGNRVHKTAENYVLNALTQKQLPVEPECLPLVQRYCDHFLKSGATLHVEKEMCFTKDLQICGWKSWDSVFFRFKGDLLAEKGPKLTYADWKSGKVKDDIFQLEVAWAVCSLHFPHIEEFNAMLIFVKEPDPKKAVYRLPKPLTRADLPAIWERIFAITNRMQEACENENFRMQTSGLCKAWCGDMTCAHNGRRGK